MLGMLACTIGYGYATQDVRAHQEASAAAIETLATVLGASNRGILQDVHSKIESTLAPETYQKLMALEQRALMLQQRYDALVAAVGADSDEAKNVKARIDQLGTELKVLMRSSGALNWRTFLAIGAAISMSTLVFRMSSGWYSKPKRAVFTFIIVSVVLEFMMRGRHAILAGWTYRGGRELFSLIRKGAQKLFGASGAGDRFIELLEDKFGAHSQRLDQALNGPKGYILAATITAVSLTAVVWATSGSSAKSVSKEKEKARKPTPA